MSRQECLLGRPVAVTVDEAARLMSCSAWSIRRLVHNGRLPTVPDMGRRVLISTAALEAFANEGIAS